MTQLLTLQQSFIKQFGINTTVGIELITHRKQYDYKEIIKRLQSMNIQGSPFNYEVMKKIPVSILEKDKASQVAVKFNALVAVGDAPYVSYPIEGRWIIVANPKDETISIWTLKLEYTQDFAKTLGSVALLLFRLISGSAIFYSDDVRVKVIGQLSEVLNDQVEKIKFLSVNEIVSGIIYPIKASDAKFAISSLPSGKRYFLFVNLDGIYMISYQEKLENASMKLISNDTTMFDQFLFPFICVGYDIPPRFRRMGGKNIKAPMFVISDCLMISGASLVNSTLNERLENVNQIALATERENVDFHILVQNQLIPETPRGFFELTQQVLSSNQTLFYKSDGIFFHQNGAYNRTSSYEWNSQDVGVFLGMNTDLMTQYHQKERKFLLNVPINTLSKSMSLLDWSEHPNPKFWTSFYKIYSRETFDSKKVEKISSFEKSPKVDVVYLETVSDEILDNISKVLKPGGYLVLRIVEKELLHSAFIAYPQSQNQLVLPGNLEIVITRDAVNEHIATSIKKVMEKLNGKLLYNYILDREILLNSTEEMITRMYSGIVMTIGEGKLSGLQNLVKEEVQVVDLPAPPIPVVSLPVPLVEVYAQSAMPIVNISRNNQSFLRQLGKEPTPIARPTTRVIKPVLQRCRSLSPGVSIQQWTLGRYPATRKGAIGDGSCLIHALSYLLEERYPTLEKSDPKLELQIKKAKEYINEERKKLAKDFTREVYEKLEISKVGLPELSYEYLKKLLNDPSRLIGYELIEYISDFYDINILFFTCDEQENKYDVYRESKKYDDYPKRDWVFILWVDENHFESLTRESRGEILYLAGENDSLPKNLLS